MVVAAVVVATSAVVASAKGTEGAEAVAAVAALAAVAAEPLVEAISTAVREGDRILDDKVEKPRMPRRSSKLEVPRATTGRIDRRRSEGCDGAVEK